MAGEDTFLYFGYGSNLLEERLKLNNPSAVFKTIGKLEGYKLEFDCWNTRWMGCVATVTECPGEHVWGTVWELDIEHRESLDKQEAVHLGYYNPSEVSVETPSGECLVCRTYQLTPAVSGSQDRRPSPQYLRTIQQGAEQSRLPPEYTEKLMRIPDNGYTGDVSVFREVQQAITPK